MNRKIKSINKVLTYIMILVLLATTIPMSFVLGNNNEINPDEDPYEKIKELEKDKEDLIEQLKPTATVPRISVTKPTGVLSIKAGATTDFELIIKNVTSDMAEKVLTEFKPSDEPKLSASIVGDNFAKIITGNGTKKMKLRISVDSTIDSGLYNLTLVHKFTNNIGEDLSSESIIQVRVTNDSTGANVVVKNIDVDNDEINPGDDFNLTANIINESNQEARNVQVTVDGTSSDSVYIKTSTSVLDFSTFSPKASDNINIALTSNKKTVAGSYPITLKLSYTTVKGEKEVKDYTFYVNVSKGKTEDDGDRELIVESISAVGKTVGVGENFKMNVTIKNTGKKDVSKIKIKAITEDIVGMDGGKAIVPKSTSILNVPTLKPGESKVLPFTFSATKNAYSENYAIGFEISYSENKKDELEQEVFETFKQYQGVNVSNPEADKKDEKDKEEKEKKISTPKIIIKEYESTPMIVQAGTEFDLNMTFQNTSSKPVKNIKVVFTVEEATSDSAERKGTVFTPVASSNTFYINNISPNGEVTKAIRLFTIPDASPKNYPITVKMEYEDMENNPYESEDIVGINVKQLSKVTTSDISIEEFAELGNPVYVAFQIYNTGKVKLSNLKVEIEGNFDATQATTFFGNLNISSVEYYDGTIFPTEVGLQEGTVIIKYEDETGEEVVMETPFKLDVTEPMPMELDENGMPINGEMMIGPDGMPIGMEGEGKSKTPFIIGGVVVVLIVVGVVIFLRMKKKRKDSELDEYI